MEWELLRRKLFEEPSTEDVMRKYKYTYALVNDVVHYLHGIRRVEGYPWAFEAKCLPHERIKRAREVTVCPWHDGTVFDMDPPKPKLFKVGTRSLFFLSKQNNRQWREGLCDQNHGTAEVGRYMRKYLVFKAEASWSDSAVVNMYKQTYNQKEACTKVWRGVSYVEPVTEMVWVGHTITHPLPVVGYATQVVGEMTAENRLRLFPWSDYLAKAIKPKLRGGITIENL